MVHRWETLPKAKTTEGHSNLSGVALLQAVDNFIQKPLDRFQTIISTDFHAAYYLGSHHPRHGVELKRERLNWLC